MLPSSFCHSVSKSLTLLGCYKAQTGSWFPTFLGNLSVPSSWVKLYKKKLTLVRDPTLPLRLKWTLPPSGLSHGLRWFETNISGLPIGPTSKVKMSRRVITQKTEELNLSLHKKALVIKMRYVWSPHLAFHIISSLYLRITLLHD